MKDCTAEGCDEPRYINTKTGKPHSGRCYTHHLEDCRDTSSSKSNSTRMYVGTEYISRTHPRYTPGRFDSWDDVSSKKVPEPNKQDTSPPQPKLPKARVIGSSKFRTRLVSSWDDTAVSNNIRHNLWLKHGVGEIIGAHIDACHAMHILSRKLCRLWDHSEWADDEENCVLAMSGFNSVMERNLDRAYWIDPFTGLFMPPIGGDYDGWMVREGVPEKHIQMYGRRPWYALMAMTGGYIEPFENGPFVKP